LAISSSFFILIIMLRTFRANPGLGGFGEREAATPDAFCQIVKELVDNAVDACCVIGDETDTVNRRVRVVIEEYKQGSDAKDGGQKLLRVTVSDNGCGMESIQDCVGAFHSSKQGPQGNQEGSVSLKKPSNPSSKNKDSSNSKKPNNRNGKSKATSMNTKTTTVTPGASNEGQTAGRYGIGLTLCLLHAQRLVPASCASIQSATRHDKDWNVVQAVVETELDSIRCVPISRLPKSSPKESGTCIGVLLPVRTLGPYT
jgi:DNA topoisomerase VI subunit B